MKKGARAVIPIRPEPGLRLPPAQKADVLAAIAAHANVQGALLPVLHAVQDALGFIPSDSIELIAYELNLTRAEVHGVISFYHHFRTTPPGTHTLRLCRAEACQAVGAAKLEQHAKQTLGIDYHGTTADGALSLEPAYCLGNCALGPSLMIDEQLCGRVTKARFDQLVADMRT